MSFRNLAIAICAGLILSMFSSQAGDLSHKIIKHSHNDYEHQNPLFDALSYNFKSIEADVYAVGDSLFVAHDFDEIKPGLTLRKLYLEPLKNELSKNNGSVYGDGEELI